MKSLAGRLGSGLVVSLLAAFLTLGLLADQALRDTAEDYIRTRLEHDSENLLSALQFQKSAPALNADHVNTIYHRPYSGHYFTLRARGVLIRSRSLWDFVPPWPQVTTGEVRVLHAMGPLGQPLLLRVAGYHAGGRDYTLAVGEDLSPLEQDLTEQRLYLAGAGTVLLVLLVTVQIVLLRRGLVPLANLRAQIPELEQGRRERLEGLVPAEVTPLVTEFNRLLQLLAQRLRRSRDAAGDLGHELKRPLTVLQQLLHEGRGSLAAGAVIQMSQQLERVQVLIERMLARARLAGEGPPAAAFDGKRDLGDLLDTVQRIHGAPPPHVQVDVPNGPWPVDREDMLELLGNLLDNALKWGCEVVSLRVRIQTDILIEVDDDGPGLAAGDDISRLHRRGVRADKSTPGHGLGLAIVDTIVRQYGGRWELGRSPELGGARVRVVLPHMSRKNA